MIRYFTEASFYSVIGFAFGNTFGMWHCKRKGRK